MLVFKCLEIGFLTLTLILALALAPSLLFGARASKNSRKLPRSEKKSKFGVVIPARDESNVIEGALRSLAAAEYPKDKLQAFVIVESESDPTVEIVKKYPFAQIFVRRDLSGVGKGYALDECFRDILFRGHDFDGFILLDADNVVDKHFLSRMNDALNEGFDIACGKRDNKNWNSSVVSAASALTFSALNLQNKPKRAANANVTLSGTGFFIKASRIDELDGWPFRTLTEDYELSTYADCMGWSSCYVEDAVYYDEQPIQLKQSIKQRSRWIKGYFTVRKRYRPLKKAAERKSVKQRARSFNGALLIALCITLIAYLVCLLGFFIGCFILQNGYASAIALRILLLLAFLYIALVLFTVYIFQAEHKQANIRRSMRIKATFFHPVFLFTYIFSAVRAIFMPNEWERIEHTVNLP